MPYASEVYVTLKQYKAKKIDVWDNMLAEHFHMFHVSVGGLDDKNKNRLNKTCLSSNKIDAYKDYTLEYTIFELFHVI